MRIAGSTGGAGDLMALQLLTRAASFGRSRSAGATASGTAQSAAAQNATQQSGAGASGRASFSAPTTYSASGALPAGATALAAIKAMAKSDTFRTAATGVADDQVRALVRDGAIATLPTHLSEAQYNSLSTAERNVYGVVSTLQGLYDAQPKTLDQALSSYVKGIVDGYPEMIAREKEGLASGALPASDGWADVIARHEAEYAAARDGRMQIHAVNDPSLVSADMEFTVTGGDGGWSGNAGGGIQANHEALQKAFGAKNTMASASPYIGTYVITW